MPPLATILAGPNGAGKSTLLAHYKLNADTSVILADAFARDHLRGGASVAAANVRAGRDTVIKLREVIAARRPFLHETNLASTYHARKVLPPAHANGFRSRLIFVGSQTPELCIARVAQRVREGGHDVTPVDLIRRRWQRGLALFFDTYCDIVDEWMFVDNTDQMMTVAEGAEREVRVHHPETWTRYQHLADARYLDGVGNEGGEAQ